jgi:hypothetical protein
MWAKNVAMTCEKVHAHRILDGKLIGILRFNDLERYNRITLRSAS